ncbi:MAG: cytochrome c3 family protein [Bacteroidota bacterium]
MKVLKCFLIIIFLSSTILYSQDNFKESHRFEKIDCQTCHKCKRPTAKDPCLLGCGRFELMSTFKYSGKVPEEITIDKLEDLYMPVHFSHEAHADMSKMSGGCTQCHHNSTSNEVEPCSNCHNEERSREDVSIPDLKGAYHQQCMNCHREWSHETECSSCHLLKGEENKIIESIPSEMHKTITPPDRITFKTKSDEGSLVTLFHNQHVNDFGFECEDCHQDETCVKCHDIERLSHREENNELKIFSAHGISEDEAHKSCSNCHDTEKNCQVCHNEKEGSPFDHKRSTGWELKVYHKDLNCKTCHGDKNQFTKLNSNCFACHKGWDTDNFKHKVTGLILDENHIELECEDCHHESNFSVAPVCDDCHDEISFPARLPGKLTKTKR